MQKKIFVLSICLLAVILFSMPTMALTTPAVSKGHGVVTAMLSNYRGLFLEGEYGLTQQLALAGRLSGASSKFGVKYQIAPNFALQGGMQGWATSSPLPYFGLNAGVPLAKELIGLMELNILTLTPESSTYLLYDLGVCYKLQSNLDIRGGFCGIIGSSSSSPALQIGIGYNF